MQIFVYLLLAFTVQMARRCEGGTESEPALECLKESDSMGATYRGTVSQTENGLECQRWDTNEPHKRYQKPDDLDNNYCRNPNPDENTSHLPWCYTNVPGDPRWEYCSIKACSSCTDVRYDNKCFVAVRWESWKDQVDYAGAIAECERRGATLANLYSQKHMNDIMNYIRKQTFFSGWMDFRTGLKFDPLANKLTLRDGADAPDGLKWYAGYPRTGTRFADWTNVILGVRSNPSFITQYLANRAPTTYKSNVLCEIE